MSVWDNHNDRFNEAFFADKEKAKKIFGNGINS